MRVLLTLVLPSTGGIVNAKNRRIVTVAVLGMLAITLAFTGTRSAQAAQLPVPSYCEGTDELKAEDLPNVVNLLECPLTGRVIRSGEITVEVPAPGLSVFGEALNVSTADVLNLEHTLDGRLLIAVDDEIWEEFDGGGQSQSSEYSTLSTAPCSDSTYSLAGYMERDNFPWRPNVAVLDEGMANAQEARDGFKAGFDIQLAQVNDCGYSDFVSATATRGADTTVAPGVNGTGCPGTFDSQNVVGFADLNPSNVAYACWYVNPVANPDELVHADVAVNLDQRWVRTVTSNCGSSYLIDAVMAHEVGHIFGMGHVSESSHPYLTMSESMSPCNFDGQSTLGAGDVLGMRVRY